VKIGDINLTGTPLHGYRIQGWLDGSTQARITWEGARHDGYAAPGAVWTLYSKVCHSDLETIQTLIDIDLSENTRLVSAVLEPLGTTDEQAAANALAQRAMDIAEPGQ
jgi:hypothetical protein